MTITLETQRLILRKPVADDLGAFSAFMMSPRADMVRRPEEAGTEGAWRAFAKELGHWEIRGYGLWAVTEKGDDTALGLIGPWNPEGWPEPEIGWNVFAGAEGKGYAFEAARAAIDDVFTRLGWPTAVSYIAPENTRSIALAERLGAVRDAAATGPHPEDLVYRHPAPEFTGDADGNVEAYA